MIESKLRRLLIKHKRPLNENNGLMDESHLTDKSKHKHQKACGVPLSQNVD